MVQCLVNMADESKLPSQPEQFLSGHQRNMWSCVILVEDFVFSRLIPDAFHQVLFSVGQIWSSTSWT